MTKKERQLVFEDICQRLPYGVIFEHDGRAVPFYNVFSNGKYGIGDAYTGYMGDNCKPYLRSMDSMSDKEQKYFDDNFCVIDEDAWKGNGIIGFKNQSQIFAKGIKWLLMNHFDFNGLIEKGLAIEVTEKNNPYK